MGKQQVYKGKAVARDNTSSIPVKVIRNRYK